MAVTKKCQLILKRGKAKEEVSRCLLAGSKGTRASLLDADQAKEAFKRQFEEEKTSKEALKERLCAVLQEERHGLKRLHEKSRQLATLQEETFSNRKRVTWLKSQLKENQVWSSACRRSAGTKGKR